MHGQDETTVQGRQKVSDLTTKAASGTSSSGGGQSYLLPLFTASA
jgi:hypothetical protein